MSKNKLSKYPDYKDSAVEWLGEIPEHWEVMPSKRFHKVKKESNYKRECNNVLSLTLRGVVNNDPDSPEGMVPKDYGTYQIFDKNNLVFKLIDLENVKTSRVGIVHEKGIMSSAYIRLIVGHNNFPRYTYYYFYSLYINEVFNNLGSGVRSTLGPTDLLNIHYIRPSIQEQTAIAHFLDDKTTKIDQAIAIKQKQIELLKERRQILIHKAVTRGLNDNVKFKDSGVEWIGKIPEHWEVKRLKYVANLVSDKMLSKGNPLNYIGMENIESWTGNYVATNSETEGLASYFKKGDILFGKLRPYLAKVYLAKDEGICTTEFLVYRNNNEIFNWYLHLLMLSFEFINLIDSSTYGSKMPRANSDFIGNQLIPIPPKEEQNAIAEFIETATTKIATAISLKEQEIEKLKEYKMSLIDGVVTGKVRVC
jgi:type I restriction enzyme S subunit